MTDSERLASQLQSLFDEATLEAAHALLCFRIAYREFLGNRNGR